MGVNVIIAMVFFAVGLAVVFAVPTAYEGPLLLPITEQHAIRLVDAIGLGMSIPSWLYLNLLLMRWWRMRQKSSNRTTKDTE
jgi:hypothetical protein